MSVLKMFNLPNLLTAGNLVCGILSILSALQGNLLFAVLVIYLAAIFDFLDGFLARKLNLAGELGKQLDSLADMVTFGIAPGVLAFVMLALGNSQPFQELTEWIILSKDPELIRTIIKNSIDAVFENQLTNNYAWLPFLGLIIPFFSLFRLAKFNIDTRQADSFIGLPTPANTIFITAFPLLYLQACQSDAFDSIIFEVVKPIYFIPTITIFSILLVSEIPLIALKFKHFKWKGNEMRFVFLGVSITLIPIFFAWSIPIIIILYLILSIIEHKRIKTTA